MHMMQKYRANFVFRKIAQLNLALYHRKTTENPRSESNPPEGKEKFPDVAKFFKTMENC